MKKILLVTSMVMFSTLVIAQWTDQTSNTSQDLNDVFFLDASNGWAVGRNGALVSTTNGGTVWAAENSATSKDLNDVFMVNSTTGYAVGDNGTVIKYSGSGTWTALTSGTTLDLFGVHFIDANTGWISGDFGRIMMTTNGGSSWTTQVNNSMYTNLFNDIFMLSANEGWAVGTTGRILKYNGSNWSNVTSGITTELLGVYFSSSNFGFAVGKNSQILYYNGTAWSTHNSGLTSYNIHNVHIISSSLAYAATSDGFGGAGIILKYNGSVWSTDYQFSGIGTEIFYGICFPNSSKGFAVGAGGLIKTFGSSSGVVEILNVQDVSISPNPIITEGVVNFSVSNPENLKVSLVDVVGREVLIISNVAEYDQGNHSILIGADKLTSGVYMLKISGLSGTATIEKLIVQ